ncbi:hypothetical protein [Breoghania sp.]|uniref:hypothetical protein n=1 Tax=Breoghania sp. TaxID=2065378 RepID=UPI0026266E52|nr:hypothetical protein [Breoghania sp.]MDJ0929995.1 hypothetical protein [Breoghania sp.]
MHSKWPKRLGLAAVVASDLGIVALAGMDMMLSAPPISRTDLETLPLNKPVRVADLIKHDLDTACVLPPHEKRVPETALDAARINDFLLTRTYGGEEAHWALVTRTGDTFALARFERSTTLDTASASDAKEIAPEGLRPVACAPGDKAVVVRLGEERSRIVFGEMD